jgi:acyl-CoA thioesterase
MVFNACGTIVPIEKGASVAPSKNFLLKRSPFTHAVGIKTSSDGKTSTLKIGKQHTNTTGYCHGGVIFSLADRAFACAINPSEKMATALEVKINYLSPVKVGDVLTTKTRLLKEGKRTTVCFIEVLRGKEPVAVALATGFNLDVK